MSADKTANRVTRLGETALVIMAKQPVVGATKTRLCPPLSPKEAASLYEALILDTIELCLNLDGFDFAIAVTPPESTAYFKRIAPRKFTLLPVDCPNIGECLTQVIGKLLAKGYKKAIAINSDGPSLPVDYIHQAARELENHDVALGPADDGGYYLIGLKRLHKEIFRGIAWSTSAVLEETLAKAGFLGLQTALLPPWYDVDTWDDLCRFQSELNKLPPGVARHSSRFLDNLELAKRQ